MKNSCIPGGTGVFLIGCFHVKEDLLVGEIGRGGSNGWKETLVVNNLY